MKTVLSLATRPSGSRLVELEETTPRSYSAGPDAGADFRPLFDLDHAEPSGVGSKKFNRLKSLSSAILASLYTELPHHAASDDRNESGMGLEADGTPFARSSGNDCSSPMFKPPAPVRE